MLGGPLNLTVKDLGEIADVLYACEVECLSKDGRALLDAAEAFDSLEMAKLYEDYVDGGMRRLWGHLAIFCPEDCELIG